MTVKEAELDIVFAGALCFDVVLSGIDAFPAPGTEIWARSRTVSPGGVANRAVAAARLGLRTGLIATTGDDIFADFLQLQLSAVDNLDLRWWHREPQAATVLSTIYTDRRNRRIISHGVGTVHQPTDIGAPPRATIAHLSADEAFPPWADDLRRSGTTLWAGVGWDGNPCGWRDTLENLRHFDGFIPNADEALALTGAASLPAAAEALSQRVPLVVVTCGAAGALAIEAGALTEVPGVNVAAVDTTGAGDTFVAALAYATVRGLPMEHRLRFANLCAALSLSAYGGAASAPNWPTIDDWQAADHSADNDFSTWLAQESQRHSG